MSEIHVVENVFLAQFQEFEVGYVHCVRERCGQGLELDPREWVQQAHSTGVDLFDLDEPG